MPVCAPSALGWAPRPGRGAGGGIARAPPSGFVAPQLPAVSRGRAAGQPGLGSGWGACGPDRSLGCPSWAGGRGTGAPGVWAEVSGGKGGGARLSQLPGAQEQPVPHYRSSPSPSLCEPASRAAGEGLTQGHAASCGRGTGPAPRPEAGSRPGGVEATGAGPAGAGEARAQSPAERGPGRGCGRRRRGSAPGNALGAPRRVGRPAAPQQLPRLKIPGPAPAPGCPSAQAPARPAPAAPPAANSPSRAAGRGPGEGAGGRREPER